MLIRKTSLLRGECTGTYVTPWTQDIRYKLLAVAMIRVEGYDKTYISPSRPWECGNSEGISKECGKGGKPASWLSMLSTLRHFHGLLFARQMLDKPICRHPMQCAAPAKGCLSVLIGSQ
jgi:hypothetical protein